MALAMGKDIEDMVQSPRQPGRVPGTGEVLLPVGGGEVRKGHCLWTCEPGSRKTLFQALEAGRNQVVSLYR